MDSVFRRLPVEHRSGLRFVLCPDQRSGKSCLIVCTGDYESDGLVSVQNLVVLQRKIGLPVRMQVTPRLWRRVHAWHIAMRKNLEDAGSLFSCARVDRDCPAVCNRALDEYAIDNISYRNICRIARGAGRFEAPVDSRKWLSNRVHKRAPASFESPKRNSLRKLDLESVLRQ